MFSFLLRKMWKNRWLMICLLIGNILLIGVVSATPLYTGATMQRILQQDLRQLQHNINQHSAILRLNYVFNAEEAAFRINNFLYTEQVLVHEPANSLDIPVLDTFATHSLMFWNLSAEGRDLSTRNIALSGTDTDRLDSRVRLIAGRMPSDNFAEYEQGFVIEAIASEVTLLAHNLLFEEYLLATNVSNEIDYYIKIVGIFEPTDDLYWTTLSRNHTNAVLISNELVRTHFIENYIVEYRVESRWYQLLDPSGFRARYTHDYIRILNEYDLTDPWGLSVNFYDVLDGHIERTAPLAITLWVLQVPMYVLLAFYIYMVSRQILQLEQNEIAVLESRGVSRFQIMGIYAMQGIFVAVISLPIGIYLGVFLCNMLGASSGFLYLVQRATLQIEITPIVIYYSLIAIGLSFLTMFIPVIGFSRVNIVAHKQKKRGQVLEKSLWQRFYLDILCLAISFYGLFTFHNQREIMSLVIRDAPQVDPLLFLSSSLFIIGAGLFILRLFPWFIRLIYIIGQRIWRPGTYAALIHVIRSKGQEFIMIFLIITLAVGIFSAHAARTINTNNEHRIMYLAGSDLTVQELWQNNIPTLPQSVIDEFGIQVPSQVVYIEPDFARFTNFSEVDSLTRVQQNNVIILAQESRVEDVRLMGIETNTFGETIWFRNDLLSIHINHFLNILAENPEGVLLSNNFRTSLGYQIGDIINIRYEYLENPPIVFNVRLEIVGFVNHFPSYSPFVYTTLDTGEFDQIPQFLAIANLGHLQTNWGMLPYEVWMKTDNNSFIYETNMQFLSFTDSAADIIYSRNEPIVQGTNGVLTMGFIVILLVCFVGFMIYWILSIRARVLQFGIFRAMGMDMKGVFSLLIYEQILITFTAIIIGFVIGEIAARLFVPLIQLSYSAAGQIIPLMVFTSRQDYINLAIIIGSMVFLCLLILLWHVTRIKIAQALKLGED